MYLLFKCWDFLVIPPAVPVTMAKVNANGVQPILNKNFNLTCDTVGFVETIYWIKNGSALQTTSRIMLDKHNTTVTFSPVLLSDNGYYECKASNLVSNLTSERHALHVACEYQSRKTQWMTFWRQYNCIIQFLWHISLSLFFLKMDHTHRSSQDQKSWRLEKASLCLAQQTPIPPAPSIGCSTARCQAILHWATLQR